MSLLTPGLTVLGKDVLCRSNAVMRQRVKGVENRSAEFSWHSRMLNASGNIAE